MSERRATFEDLIEGRVGSVSLVNEPVTFEVDFVVPAETATARARRRWWMEDQDE